MNKLKSIFLAAIFMVSAGAMAGGSYDFDAITNTELNNEKMLEYAEKIYPGITDDVVFRSGNLEGLCTCGGWFTHGLVGDKYVPQIVISNKAFSSKWIGGAYDLYYGYHPFAYYTVAHEIAHYANELADGYGHDDGFKHFVQVYVPEHLWKYEAGYKYPGGEDMFDPDKVY